MGNEKLNRKDFFKRLTALKENIGEAVLDLPPGDPDPLFEKYARKNLGPRRYSEVMETPVPGQDSGATNRYGNVTSNLTPYTGTWSEWEAAHVLRRVGFGAKRSETDWMLTMTVSNAIDAILNTSAPANPSPTPLNYYQNTLPDSGGILLGDSWTSNNLTYVNTNDGTNNAYRQYSLTAWSWGLCINDGTSIREKMTLFWYHFIPVNFDDVRDLQGNSATMCNDYMSLLRTNALGNFKTLIKAIAKTPAMLVYLGNQSSTANVPNENFARELMELFTLGKVPTQNYMEIDVIAASKVLSGWRVPSFTAAYPFTPGFYSNYHNQSAKTFSSFFSGTTITNQAGAAGANEFDIFFDLLFNQQGLTIAKYICRRLYRFFVYYDIDANIETNVIEPLAALLLSSNWEMMPVMKALLKSQHFFDLANRGVMIKSPVDFIAGALRTLKINTTAAIGTSQVINQYAIWQYFHNYANTNMDQGYGLVPNVSGWKAYYQGPAYYQNWINSNSIQKRAALLTAFMNGFTVGGLSIKIDVIGFVQQFANPVIQNPDSLVDAIVQLLLPVDLPADYKLSTKVATLLQGQVTNTYWTSAWDAYTANPTTGNANIIKTRLNSLMTTLLQLAEFQLV